MLCLLNINRLFSFFCYNGVHEIFILAHFVSHESILLFAAKVHSHLHLVYLFPIIMHKLLLLYVL